MSGAVYGRPGGSLENASWLKASDRGAAKVGASGEQRTADLLDRYAAESDVTVLHDLRVPSSKYKANIDHVVVSGNRVFVIDSKVWKPGRYWTDPWGRTFRGFERFEPAEKQTMVVIDKTLEAMFRNADVQAQLVEPLLFVWPSSTRKKMSTWMLRVPGARVVAGTKIEPMCDSLFASRRFSAAGRAADQDVVDQLRTLLY